MKGAFKYPAYHEHDVHGANEGRAHCFYEWLPDQKILIIVESPANRSTSAINQVTLVTKRLVDWLDLTRIESEIRFLYRSDPYLDASSQPYGSLRRFEPEQSGGKLMTVELYPQIKRYSYGGDLFRVDPALWERWTGRELEPWEDYIELFD